MGTFVFNPVGLDCCKDVSGKVATSLYLHTPPSECYQNCLIARTMKTA